MNRRIYITYSGEFGSFSIALCAAFFLFGSAVGALLARSVYDADFVLNLLFAFSDDAVSLGAPSFLGTVFDTALIFILILIFAYSVFGVFFIPAFLAIRGALYSFVLCITVRLLGTEGLLFSLLFSGLELVFLSPFFLLMASGAMETSFCFFRLCFGKNKSFDSNILKKYFLIHIICLTAAVLFTVFKCFGLFPLLQMLYPG